VTDHETTDVVAADPDGGDDRPDVASALRAGLTQYALSEEDLALVEGGDEGRAVDEDAGPLPVLAVVGRPNVGKSTLVNRIIGRREAVVEDVPGVTRDRVTYEAEWTGRRFVVVDTGGWERQVDGLDARVAEQAEIAIELADAVMFVVDATVGATTTDEAVVKLLRRSGKPVILAANKVDDQRGESDAASLWGLGLGEPYPVSAVHGPCVASTVSVICTSKRAQSWSSSAAWATSRATSGASKSASTPSAICCAVATKRVASISPRTPLRCAIWTASSSSE